MAARPITIDTSPRDVRAELYARLQDAPQEHAEALLAACEVLQGLHDRGVLELLRGLLGSSSEVLEIAVGAAKSPDSIRTIRNLLVLVKLLGSIDPVQLSRVAQVVPQVVEAVALPPEKHGLWRMAVGWLLDSDVRVALAALQKGIKAFGQRLRAIAS